MISNLNEFENYQKEKEEIFSKLQEIDNDKLRHINRYILNVENIFKIFDPEFITFKTYFNTKRFSDNDKIEISLSNIDIFEEDDVNPLPFFRECVFNMKRSIEYLIEMESEYFQSLNFDTYSSDFLCLLNNLYNMKDGFKKENRYETYEKILSANKQYLSSAQQTSLLNMINYIKGENLNFGNLNKKIGNDTFHYIHMNNKDMDENTEKILKLKHKLAKKYDEEIIFLMSECLLFKHLNYFLFSDKNNIIEINFDPKNNKVYLSYNKEVVKEFEYFFMSNFNSATLNIDIRDIRKSLLNLGYSNNEMLYEKVMKIFNNSEKNIIKNKLSIEKDGNLVIKRL